MVRLLRPDTAVTRLVRAFGHIQSYETPLRVVPAVENYFAVLARLEPDPLRHQLSTLGAALEDPIFRQEFSRNPRQNTLIRNTMTPTVLAGSAKTNVIPAEAHAQIDCRLLPGEDPARFLRKVREIIADDTVEV